MYPKLGAKVIWLISSVLILSLISCSSTGSNDGEDIESEPPADTTPPDTPINLSATSDDRKILLKWDAVDAGDLAGYNVYRSTSSISGTSTLTPINDSGLVNTASFTDESVQNGTTYYYRVTSVDNEGNESTPSIEVESTPFATPPSRP